MPRVLVLTLVSLMFFCTTASAQKGSFGLGVIIGEPTGLSFKGFVTDTDAVDGGVAWSFGDHDSFHLHADYLTHRYDIFRVKKGRLPLYFGVGGRLKFDDNASGSDVKFGVRIPVGIAYMIPGTPLEAFAEAVPVVDLAPDTEADFNGGFGIRYYFR